MAQPRRGKQPPKDKATQVAEARKYLSEHNKPIPESDNAALNRARFLRLAPARTNRALKVMTQVERLFGVGYEPEGDEAERIAAAIMEGAQRIAQKAKGERVKAEGFTL